MEHTCPVCHKRFECEIPGCDVESECPCAKCSDGMRIAILFSMLIQRMEAERKAILN